MTIEQQHEEDCRVINNMIEWGGTFVKRLGLLAQHADKQNLETIKQAFPNYWERYKNWK